MWRSRCGGGAYHLASVSASSASVSGFSPFSSRTVPPRALVMVCRPLGLVSMDAPLSCRLSCSLPCMLPCRLLCRLVWLPDLFIDASPSPTPSPSSEGRYRASGGIAAGMRVVRPAPGTSPLFRSLELTSISCSTFPFSLQGVCYCVRVIGSGSVRVTMYIYSCVHACTYGIARDHLLADLALHKAPAVHIKHTPQLLAPPRL